MSRNVFLVLGLAGGALLSFLLLGLLWIGQPVYLQALAGISLFCLVGFGVGFGSRRFLAAFLMLMLGAAPLGGVITAFRDPEGSHVKFVGLVLGWIAGALLGAWLGAKRGNAPR